MWNGTFRFACAHIVKGLYKNNNSSEVGYVAVHLGIGPRTHGYRFYTLDDHNALKFCLLNRGNYTWVSKCYSEYLSRHYKSGAPNLFSFLHF